MQLNSISQMKFVSMLISQCLTVLLVLSMPIFPTRLGARRQVLSVSCASILKAWCDHGKISQVYHGLSVEHGLSSNIYRHRF